MNEIEGPRGKGMPLGRWKDHNVGERKLGLHRHFFILTSFMRLFSQQKKIKKVRRSDHVAVAKEEERRLHQLELSRLEESRTPQTALEFEALLQSSPNSSAVWIQFISFHLEVTYTLKLFHHSWH